jgi:hypothetical protein
MASGWSGNEKSGTMEKREGESLDSAGKTTARRRAPAEKPASFARLDDGMLKTTGCPVN